jgi:hypothetical protein
MTTGTAFFNSGMGICHPRRRTFMTLQTELRLLLNQQYRTSTGMWLICRDVTNQAITFCNRCMNVLRPTKETVTVSGKTTIRRIGPGPKHKTFARRFDSTGRLSQGTKKYYQETRQTI